MPKEKDQRHNDDKSLEPRGDYLPEKPQDQRQSEYKIRQSLIEQGLDREIADAVVGYTPEQVPFVYRSEPHEFIDGNSGKKMMSEIWIGTTDEIHNLDITWGDQAPEVVTQWRGHTRTKDGQTVTTITREEVHPLPDGSFVRIKFNNVTAMGEFDGELAGMDLHVPKGTFRPWGGERVRQSFQMYSFQRHERSDSHSALVPWRKLDRKDEPEADWTIDLTRSNVESTSMLNGLGEMINFHLSEIEPVKADFDGAYRFTALPEEPEIPMLTAGTPEEEYQLILNEVDNPKREVVVSLQPRVLEMMTLLAPMVRDFLATGAYQRDAEGMAVDGILRHPEKITIMGRRLSDLSREQRFKLAQIVSQSINSRKFREWVESLNGSSLNGLVQDTANRNAYHLLSWFARTAPADADLSGWVQNAEEVVLARSFGEQKEGNMEFQRIFDGMCTSFVERFVEFIAQQYYGNILT